MASIASYFAPASGDSLVPTGRFDGAGAVWAKTAPLNVIATVQGGTVIDSLQTSRQLDIRQGSTLLNLIGLKTEGYINLDGTDVNCWYGDHSHPGVNRSNPGAWVSTFHSPDAMAMRNATRVNHYGCTIHDMADAADIAGARECWFTGCLFVNPYRNYLNVWHSDIPDSNVNSAKSYTTTWGFRECFIDCSEGSGIARLGGAIQMQATNGDIDAQVIDCWIRNSSDVNADCSAASGHTCRLTIVNTHAWNQNGQGPAFKHGAGTVTVVGAFILSNPGGTDPATLWRAAHPYSTWRSFLGLGGPTAPSVPVGVTATAGDTTAIVSFSAPAANGGSPITGYTASRSPGTGANDIHLTATQRSALFTGLTNGVAYTLSVVAENAAGDSSPASAAPVTPAGASAPGTPTITDIDPSIDNSGRFSLVWTRPADGGKPIDAFRVTTSPSTGNHDFPGSALGGVINGVVGTPYTAQVKAHNSVGYGSLSAASASVTPTSSAQPLWRDSLGGTPGENSVVPAADQVSQWAQIGDDWGDHGRYIVGIESFRSNNATADAGLDRIEASGLGEFLVCVNYFADTDGDGLSNYPVAGLEATYRAAFTAMATRYASRYPGLLRRYEFINEPNNTMRPRSIVNYAFWYKAFFEEMTAADPDCEIVTGGPAHLITNKPTATVGSNVYGRPYVGGAQEWSETDWIADHCNPAVVGAGNDLPTVGCHAVGMHTYCGEKGGLSTFDRPAGQNGPGTEVNGMRELSRVDAILTAAGLDVPIDITEMGFATAPSWKSGVSNPLGTVMFPTQGTPNGQTLWNRPTVYIAYAATNTQPGSGGAPWVVFNATNWGTGQSIAVNKIVFRNGHQWRATTAHTSSNANAPGTAGAPWQDLGASYQAGEAPNIINTENEAAFHWRNVLRIWFAVIPDADGQPIDVAKRRYGRLSVFMPWDLVAAPRFRYGLRYEHGAEKGTPVTSGPWAMFKSLADQLDKRRELVIPALGAGWEPCGGIPIEP